jgi:exonuclease SbcC
MFRQIFGSRLQHPDAEVRRQAVADLEGDDPRLIEIALADASDAVRLEAVRRASEPGALASALQRPSLPARIREEVLDRLTSVLCKPVADEQDEAQRVECVEQLNEPLLLRALLTGADSPRLRAIALARTDDQQQLAQVAAGDPSGRLRLAALERVTEEGALETIAREARNRDKGVARAARERVEGMRAARERLAEGERLCEQIERLAQSALEAADEAAFQHLEQRFAKWSTAVAGNEDLQQRYERHRDALQQRLLSRAALRRRRAELIAKLEQATSALRTIDPEQQIDAAITGPSELKGEWSRLQDGATEQERAQFAGVVAALDEACHRLRHDAERARAARALLSRLETAIAPRPPALDAAGPTPRVEGAEDAADDDADAGAATAGDAQDASAALALLWREWEGLEKPEHEDVAARLHDAFEALRRSASAGGDAAGATARPSASRTRADDRSSAMASGDEVAKTAEMLKQAQHLIETGELQRAANLADRVRHRLEGVGRSAGGSSGQVAGMRKQLMELTPRLSELRGWRRWSTEQARERLCDEVEQLIGATIPPSRLARQIQGYRETWKKMDRAEGGASKAMWERFNTACTRAYEPCRAHFSAEAEQRRQNLAAKTALLQTMEDRLAGIDWDGEVDWPSLDREYTRLRREWRTVGAVGRRDNRALHQRYDALRESLESRLGPVRERELDRRRAIVVRLTDLAAGDDLRGAADAAKRAQSTWTPLVRAPRKVEQALWTDFRSACDRIFNGLREQRARQQGERDEARQRSEHCCERIEALATALEALGVGAEEGSRERELLAQVDAARREFAGVGEVPRASEGALRRRYRDAIERVDSVRASRRLAVKQQGLASLASRVAAIEPLEALLMDAGADASVLNERAASVQSQWEAMSPIRDKGLAAVSERYQRALAAARGDDALAAALRAEADRVRGQREALLLDLEIATGIDSPAEFQAARMAHQVDRLQASLTGATPSGEEGGEIDGLLRRWYALGPVAGAEERDALNRRFERAAALAATSRRSR